MLANFAPLTPLRRIWRRLGLNEILNHLENRHVRREIASYRKNPRTQESLKILHHEVLLKVSSEAEYYRIVKTRDDRKLLNPFLNRLLPGQVAWDVGTSIGTYSLLMAKQLGPTGRVIGFEPEPGSFARLQDNVNLNNLKNIRCLEMGLASKSGSFEIAVAPDFGAGIHSFLKAADPASSPRRKTVSVRSGDELVSEGYPQPHAVKIDVEGFEDEVVLGMRKTLANPDCRTVLCEVHFSLMDQFGKKHAVDLILKTLKECGFHKITWPDFQHFLAIK